MGMDTEQLKIDLERIAGQRPLAEGETMVHILGRLDVCANATLIPARLKHYLSKRSYIKALAWLADSSTPHQL
ncbi:hypothetical protein ACWPKO_16260 [Coraliomargarita sp. W4R53]